MPFVIACAFVSLRANRMIAPYHPCYLCNPRLSSFRCEGGDDFFEARIAAQRVPIRHQLQLAIADADRKASGTGKLFAGEVVITNPRSDSSQGQDHPRAVDRILLHGKQLNRAPTFAECFVLSPQGQRRLSQGRIEHQHHQDGR